MPSPNRPPRAELFGFYFLGFNPEGAYGFANAHHVAGYYKVTVDQILRWLDELDLTPRRILHRQFYLGRAQADLQIEAPLLTPEGLRARITEILAELDDAPTGRRVWEEE